jgi:hypothetical protein
MLGIVGTVADIIHRLSRFSTTAIDGPRLDTDFVRVGYIRSRSNTDIGKNTRVRCEISAFPPQLANLTNTPIYPVPRDLIFAAQSYRDFCRA